jgi:putative phosphoesterase
VTPTWRRVAVIYDIHANLPALEGVLEDIRRSGVDGIVVGGDVVPGPMPRETIARLQAVDLPVEYILGNGDREVLAVRRGVETGAVPERFREAMRWNASQLDAADEALLAGWPSTRRVRVESLGDVLFCHATPRSDTEIFTRLTSEERLLPVFDGLGAPLVICGHTHMQFERTVGAVRVVNAGSVGMPFGNPGAYWLMLGPGIELRHTPYDLGLAAERIRRTSYPLADEFAAHHVLRPAAEDEILRAYAAAELK